MTVTDLEQDSVPGNPAQLLHFTTTSGSQNNLNRASHTRTHSHPLSLTAFSQHPEGDGDLCPPPPHHPPSCTLLTFTPLTDALNLDFVNIPSESSSTKKTCTEFRSPGSIPASAMQKYLHKDGQSGSEISDILVDLDLDLDLNPQNQSPAAAAEVAKVLDNFNTLLERITLDSDPVLGSDYSKFISPTVSSGAGCSSAKIKSSVEAFAELLLRGETDSEEDEDLLIVVDDGSGGCPSGELGQTPGEENDGDEVDDQLCSLHEGEEEEDLDLEGYESDRPMVRASMRKLRPIKVKLKPVVESSCEFGEGGSGGGGGSDLLCSVLVMSGESGCANSGANLGSTSTGSGNLQEVEGEGGSATGTGSTSGERDGSTSPSPGPSSRMNFMTSNELMGGGGGGIMLTLPAAGGVTVVDMSILTSIATSSVPVYSANPAGSSSSSNPPESQSTSQSTLSTSNNATTSTPASGTASTSTSTSTTPLSTSTTTPTSAVPPTTRRRIGVTAGSSVPTGRWPHRLSSVLALIGCTLGLNNVCRFGLLSVNYGANFVVQWVFLSAIFGVPLLTFHMSLGQYLHSGIIGMWKISPIFQGIGVGLLFSQALVGLYSTVGVSWMLIYFRDSFITRGDQYRWGKCVREFRECDPYQSQNQTSDLSDTVPDYFSAVVLQRSSPDYPNSVYVPNSLKFTVAFNLAVVWMLIFVSLSKGLKSYGKVVHGFVLAPVAALFVLTFKMVGVVENTASLFGQTAWVDFFFNTQTWVVAAREVFFTWGLLGACVMQVTSHNRHAHPLKSDAVIVVLVTTVVLLLSAFIGNSCLSIIATATPATATTLMQRYSYGPSSFESDRTYKFLSVGGLGGHKIEDSLFSTPSGNLHHNPLLMGVRILRTDSKAGADPTASGYQVLRLATELFPAAMAVLSPNGLSPFWTVLFYFTLVLFGLAQQLAIWHTVIKGIIAIRYKMLKSWETTITFFVCAMGFALGLPLCTETGVFVTYFLDFAVGSGWWIMILYLLELVAVFIVRGAPYCGENIVTVLITGPGRIAKFMAPLVSFIWNVIMPVALLVLSIASFKSGNIRELYDWNPNRGYIFWPSWTREVGSLIQLLPILAVPFVAIVQSCRYLTNGSSDVFERMQQLYRPSTRLRFGSATSESGRERRAATGRSEDPPPKYTPPPSYSTATGAKIARFLRNSIRRSMRRITTNPNGTSGDLPPPPAYASVILEINHHHNTGSSGSSAAAAAAAAAALPPPLYSEATGTTPAKGGTIDTFLEPIPRQKIPLSHTLSSDFGRKERSSGRRISSEINSRDIARMLSLRSNGVEDLNQGHSQGQIQQEVIQVPGTSTASGEGLYTFSRGRDDSLTKIDYDLEFLRHLEDPDLTLNRPPTFDLLSFNRSRNRNSNDSQLALISDGYLYDNGRSSSRTSSRADVELDVDMRLGFHHPQRHSEA